jgi:hypothetical protein
MSLDILFAAVIFEAVTLGDGEGVDRKNEKFFLPK